MNGDTSADDGDDDGDNTPLTAEEIAERDAVPTWGEDIFERAVVDLETRVLGDVLIDRTKDAKTLEKSPLKK